MPDYDTTEHAKTAYEQAQVAYGIYADYDGNAPDTASLLFCSTEELAKAVCTILNETPRRWGNLAFVDGSEWSKSFSYSKVFVPLDQKVPRSVAEVMADVEDEGNDEDEDGDDD